MQIVNRRMTPAPGLPGTAGFGIGIAAVMPLAPEILHLTLGEQRPLVLLAEHCRFLRFGAGDAPGSFKTHV